MDTEASKDSKGAAESGPGNSRASGQVLTVQQRSPAACLPPALRSWIDSVIVPALVREYLHKKRTVDEPE